MARKALDAILRADGRVSVTAPPRAWKRALRAPSFLVRVAGQSIERIRYVVRGRTAWSPGYLAHRNAQIASVIDGPMLRAFSAGRSLPAGYGSRLDERIVEYPWAIAKLSEMDSARRVLDAGATLNHPMILNHPSLRRRQLVIASLGFERHFRQASPSYVRSDLRNLGLRARSIDVAVCISTLEHVGMDNERYAAEDRYRECDPEGYKQAIRELRAAIASGGSLLLTVPFGITVNMGWQQQFDSVMLSEAIAAFRPSTLEATFYRYGTDGWQVATESDCRDAEYYDFTREREAAGDGAAAARAVACVQMTTD